MNPWDAFAICRRVANGSQHNEQRRIRIGAVAIRSDGALVKARNGQDRDRNPQIHAEHRVLRKAGTNAVVYVCRVVKGNSYRLARPCTHCLKNLKNRGVKRCYYTISDTEYGVLDL